MNYHLLPGIRLIYTLCLFASFSLQAQEKAPLREPDHNKPKLFNALPQEIPVNRQELLSIVSPTLQKSQEVNLSFTQGRSKGFTGKIAYAFSRPDGQLRTVTVQSTNFNGAVLTLSSLTNADGTTSLTGRIFSYQHGDALELQEKNNQYYWVKKNLFEMMTE